MKKYLSIGRILRNKPNDRVPGVTFSLKLENPYKEDPIFPIKLANGLVLNEGDYLTLFDEEKRRQILVEEGKISSETAKNLSFIKYSVCINTERLQNKNNKSNKKSSNNDPNDPNSF